MTTTDTTYLPSGQLATQAADTIRLLNHRTRPAVDDWCDPLEAAEIIAALASLTSMLPQLLAQLARSVEHEHHHDRLRVDSLAPLPDPNQAIEALTGSLHRATQNLHRAAAELDRAHQHAAHLAPTGPPPNRGQHSCRSVGPNHLTRPTPR